jgi:hypothetical protein
LKSSVLARLDADGWRFPNYLLHPLYYVLNALFELASSPSLIEAHPGIVAVPPGIGANIDEPIGSQSSTRERRANDLLAGVQFRPMPPRDAWDIRRTADLAYPNVRYP